ISMSASEGYRRRISMSASAAGLLAPDPVLRHRDWLLDVEAVRRVLATRLGDSGVVGLDRCERVRADYRFGRRLRVLHGARIARRWQWICGRTFPDGETDEAFRQVATLETPRNGLRAVV